MDDYDLYMSTRPRQTGILTVAPATANGNRFYLLDTGLNFQEIYQNTHYTAQGNGFTHCRIGVNLQQPGGGYPNLPATVANLGCNTFRRMDGFRRGSTIGVRIAYAKMADLAQHNCTNCPTVYFYAGIRIDDPAMTPNTTYMKNWFDDSNVASGYNYYSIVNEQPGYTLNYKTFGTVGATNPFQINWGAHDNNLAYGTRNIPSTNSAPNLAQGTETCQYQLPTAYPNAGLQFRPASNGGRNPVTAGNSLMQNWPNPAESTTSFSYHLQSDAKEATLLIRRATDGRELQRLPLNLRSESVELLVRNWPAGTYFATLLVNNVPTSTRRILVR